MNIVLRKQVPVHANEQHRDLAANATQLKHSRLLCMSIWIVPARFERRHRFVPRHHLGMAVAVLVPVSNTIGTTSL